jgi:hypothetical protein
MNMNGVWGRHKPFVIVTASFNVLAYDLVAEKSGGVTWLECNIGGVTWLELLLLLLHWL